MTQVQVGCVAHCYGSTTLDSSGLTLAQIEQLLNELHLPPPPTATAGPAAARHSTQQTATQSQSGDGRQSQVASQTNGTVQVVVTPAGAPGDAGAGSGAGTGAGAGAEAINQTAQGVVQLQVGCIFYCSGTRQVQHAEQSTATIQEVDGTGASAANTVSRVVYQVQVGCIAWCHDAVESQTATGTDSTVVSTAPPRDATAPVDVSPGAVAPTPPAVPVPDPTATSAPPFQRGRTRDSGGAPLRMRGRRLGPGSPTGRPGLGTDRVSAVSVLAATGNGAALVSVVMSEAEQVERTHHSSPRARHLGGHRDTARAPGAAPVTPARAGAGALSRVAVALPDLELAVAFVLVALGIGAWRWRDVP